MSDAVAAWAAAFVAAQAEMPEIPKARRATIRTRDGGQYAYSYADLPAILAAVSPVLAKHGLGVAQSVEIVDGGVAVRTRIYHVGGHVEELGPLVLPAGEDARAVGSAITYARRYSLCAALGISADEDDDAATAGKSVSAPRGRRPVARPGPGQESGTVGAAQSGTPSYREERADIASPASPRVGADTSSAAESLGDADDTAADSPGVTVAPTPGTGVGVAEGGAAAPTCPPHDPDMTVEPRAWGRRPCLRCKRWVQTEG